MRKRTRIVLIIILFFMLFAVRAIAQHYFYDPLIEYFKKDYLYSSIPEINFGKFFSYLFLRYLLNTTVSCAIIFLAFYNLKVLLFSIKFYVVTFVLLSVFLFVLLKYNFNQSYLLIFYVRRFLIHPLFLLILLPAFYYQRLKIKL